MGSLVHFDLDHDYVAYSSKPAGWLLPSVIEEDLVNYSSKTTPDERHGHDDSPGSIDRDFGQPSAKKQRNGFSCEACRMTFTEKRALARHKKTDHHRKELGLPPDRKHTCMTCGKNFTRGHDLKRHQNEQHPVEPFSTGLDTTRATSSGESESSFERLSENPSSVTAGSQASNETDSTSVYAAAETSCDSAISLPDGLDEKSGWITISIEGHGPAVRNHHVYESESLLRLHEQHTTPVIDLTQKADEEDHMADVKTSPTSQAGRSGLEGDSDHMNSAAAAAPQLPTTYAATPELLAQLSTQPFEQTSAMFCALCKEAFEDDSDELLGHLRRHLGAFQGAFKCDKCQIMFTDDEDLQRHLQCAKNGHCGFGFPHFCTGHHPPSIGDKSGVFSDYDRARLCVQLHNWDQAKLRAYITCINELTTSRQTRRLMRWSDVWRGHNDRNSHDSFAISVVSRATAPCDVSGGQIDIGGLQKRMMQMTLGNVGSKVRRRIHPGGSSGRSKTADDQLRKAIKKDDVVKAGQALASGANAEIVHKHNNRFDSFSATALWGANLVMPLISEHNINEQVRDNCDVCDMSFEHFKKANHKTAALILHGADPNEKGGLCGFPLATASWMGRADLVNLLLQHGADIQTEHGKYGTALCAAADQAGYPGQKDVISLLLRRGADVHASGPQGTALELAKARYREWYQKFTATPVDELRERLACCEATIKILTAEEQKPFKRCATPVLRTPRHRSAERPMVPAPKTTVTMPGFDCVPGWTVSQW